MCELQNICLIYEDGKKANISYQVNTNYNTNSMGLDMEDTFVKEYDMEVNNVCVYIKQYQMLEGRDRKIRATFEYNDNQYFITGNGLKEEEFNKIIKNLNFFEK